MNIYSAIALSEAIRKAKRATGPKEERFTVEGFAAGHSKQLRFMTDRSQWIHVMCARQSGKTWGDLGIMLDNALNQPGSTNVLLGLKGTGVKVSNWFPLWKPICERFGVPDRCHNETLMMTTLDNRSRVMFAGTDDLTNVKKYLGNRLANGVFIIDESQDQPDGTLRYLLGTLLPPMLTPTSRVILSGVLPDVEAGHFYELSTAKGWSHHEWGRAANVHTPEAMEQLAKYMLDHDLDENDPQIQRDWYMRRVWDPKATAYHYKAARNGYQPEPPEWLEDVLGTLEAAGVPYAHWMKDEAVRHGLMVSQPPPWMTEFSVAIDPGSTDRFPIEVVGWGEASPEVRQVFEWSPPRGARVTWGQVAPILGVIRERFNPGNWFYDAGGSNVELDAFAADYDIPVIKAARKVDLPGQVRRTNDLYEQGRLKLMVGSAAEQDVQRARWDKEARARSQWKWDSQWHPDPSEAKRYALQGYFNEHVAPAPPKSSNELRREAHERRHRPRPSYERDAAAIGMAENGDWAIDED